MLAFLVLVDGDNGDDGDDGDDDDGYSNGNGNEKSA